jgi:hypothetical protein
VLSAVIETLRQNPERYNIIFNNNNGNNHINTYEQQDAVLEASAKLSKVLIDQLVNQTMSTLELKLDIESEDTESTAESKANIVAENTASSAVEGKEEEVKPQETDKADNNNKSTQDTSAGTTTAASSSSTTATEEQTEDTEN